MSNILSQSTQSTPGYGSLEGDRQLVDLSQYEDCLTPTSKGKYECPVCGGKNLSYSRTEPTKFKCFSGDCDSLEILKAIAPERFEKGATHQAKAVRRSPAKKAKPAPIPESGELARLSEKPVPPQKHQDSKGKHTTYSYSDTQWVIRLDPANGNRKRFTPHHINEGGQTIAKKGDKPWPLYKEEEAIANGSGKWILWVEGEQCTEALRWLQLVAIAFMGGANRTEKESAILRLQKAGIAGIARIRDNDKTGFKKSAEVADICHQVAMPTVELADYLPILESEDIADLIKANLNNPEELIAKLERAFGRAMDKTREAVENLPDDCPDKPEKKSASHYANDLFDEWRDRLAWDIQAGEWKWYGVEKPGLWSRCDVIEVEAVIRSCLDKEGKGYGAGLVASIERLMRSQFRVKQFDANPKLIPFIDGVFNLDSNSFGDHAPGYRLTWQLPRRYHSPDSGDFGSIAQWLDFVTYGDRNRQRMIECFIAAGIRGMSNLHKFLFLIGKGGTGKSTLVRLIEQIAGEENCWNGTIASLSDKHEIIDLKGKRFAIHDDQDSIRSCGLSEFKKSTGGMKLRGRHLHQNPVEFAPSALHVVTANYPIFHGSESQGAWLSRRIMTMAFDREGGPEVRSLESKFKAELPAFTRYLLSISSEEIEATLRGGGNDVAMSPAFWESKLRDSLPAWVNEHLVFDPTARTQIGSNCDEWKNDAYKPEASTLFGAYNHYCRGAGVKSALNLTNFTPTMKELFESLGWKVEAKRDSKARYLQGVRLRREDDLSPTILEILQGRSASDDPSDGLVTTLVTTPEPLLCKDSDDYDGSISNIEELEKEEIDFSSQPPEKTENLLCDDDKPVTPVTIPSGQGFEPVTQPTPEPVTEPVTGNKAEVSPIAPEESGYRGAAIATCRHLIGQLEARGVSRKEIELTTLNAAGTEDLDQIDLDTLQNALPQALQDKLGETLKIGEKVGHRFYMDRQGQVTGNNLVTKEITWAYLENGQRKTATIARRKLTPLE
ncbi:DNA primase family protein [Oscillatoria acuminata]|uniref:Putative ATPase n=1 Tax=Oscillatoria acuminata PCC 6304 TaxID=56110 RepID=K9TTI4_9CYAN|nr:DUF5906 domain-containing protein [Oscillatoria acuminata]AFY85491.1 putative ATPase [Oscillatoria acuminata PCC 6304]